jgi:ECF transporter S component (folate family)
LTKNNGDNQQNEKKPAAQSAARIPVSAIPVLALLIALNVLLTHPLSINTETLRIGFGFLPIALAAILYGPIYTCAAAVIGDVVGALLFPTGAFFPGFTLTALLTGLIYGMFLYRKDISWKRMLLPALLVCLLLNLGMDTFWLYLMYGKGVVGQIPLRILKTAILLLVQVFLTPFVWNRLRPLLKR